MTANEQYRKYKSQGGTLNFSKWITTQKKRGFLSMDGSVSIPDNKPLSDSIQQTLSNMHSEDGVKTSVDKNYVFGINKNVWIGIGLITLAITGYVVYKRYKK